MDPHSDNLNDDLNDDLNEKYLSQMNSKQLSNVLVVLQRKTDEVGKLIGQKLIQENRSGYLKIWAELAGLSQELINYFVENANIDDFILENGYYHYYSKFGASMTFQIWSCRWLLENKGDYVSFHKKPDGYNLVLKYSSDISNLSDLNDIRIEKLTEYVIYNAIKTDPYILRITKANQLFSGKSNRHFTQLDKVR